MIKINRKLGILFLFTGLPGTGKTTLANKIIKKINKKFGPTLLINGDDVRNIFNLKKYSQRERKKVDKIYINLIKFIIKQKRNLLFTTIYLPNRDLKKDPILKKSIRIHMAANYLTRYKFKKNIYKLRKNVPGKNFKANKVEKAHIFLNNDISKNINSLEKEFWKKLNEKFIS